MKAFLKNYQQSPRKVRLVADLIRGKSVKQAEVELTFLPKKAALPVKKLLQSAVANARENFNLETDKLYIEDIQVDEGVTMKRWRPRAFGRAFPINRRSSHVHIKLGTVVKK